MTRYTRKPTKKRVFVAIALIFVVAFVLVALFRPQLVYKIEPQDVALESPDYWRMLEGIADSRIVAGNKITVLPNGENFYPAELEAIHGAHSSVNLEAYIFQKGELTRRFVSALAERARAGVEVRVVVDGMGSLTTPKDYFKELTDAGGKVNYYNPLRWYSWDKYNSRTHRELIVIDGQTAFMGGAGFADHWDAGVKGQPRWRDTVCRVDGPVVQYLQSTFVENWLESSGELLTGLRFFPKVPEQGRTWAMNVNSTPSQGRSSRARSVMQELIVSAKKSIYITTPYFLPNKNVRDQIISARRRGVDVKILTPGRKSDHYLTRTSSRRIFGELLKEGIEIYEYQPAMIHAKIMIVDDSWAMIGSSNFDPRSFGINDEVNLVMYDGEASERLLEDFRKDLGDSKPVTLEMWEKRPIMERMTEFFGYILERQQ